jgi:hypothetical protein
MDLPSDDTRLRLTEIETKLADQHAQNAQMLAALNSTLRLLTNMSAVQAAPLPPTAPLPPAPATKNKTDLKPSPPPNFDGDRHKGRGFLNACQAYFRLRPDNFPDEQTKIQWAMTYMNQGRAQKWANRVYHWEAVPANVGNSHFVDWDDFHSRFRAEFFPLHSDAVATNKLEGTTYFQGHRLVDDYLDDFRDLISESGYFDPKTIVVKFRRGLNPGIADAVATMAAGRPDDLDPEAWYEAAIRINQNQAANAAFRSAHQPAFQPKPLTTRFAQVAQPSFPNRQNFSHPSAPPAPKTSFPSRFAHAQPTPGNPVPMDIDTLDIRNFDRDTVEVLLQKLNARMDEMNLATPESEDVSEVTSPSEEDFPPSSK